MILERCTTADGVLAALSNMVGNTPMIEISYLYKGEFRKLYAKCEHYNLTGSIKDRMALYIMQKGYEYDLIHPEDIIVEASSGNTGISFSSIGRALGHEVVIIMPDYRHPDAFVAGVGTGGTVMGVGRYFKKKNPAIKVYPLEPAESPTLSTGYKNGSHRIQGITDEFIPPVLKLHELDEVIQASDGDSILMSQKLAKQLGLAVGISSGANFLGAVQAQNKLGKIAVIVTVLDDSNNKYLSTDLVKEEPAKENYYSNDIELLEYRAIK